MKKIFMLATTVAIALSSCSKNDIADIAVSYENLDVIGLNVGTFTTKADDTTTASLETDGNKLTFYSTEAIFGTKAFTYTSGAWKVDNTATWEYVTFPFYIYSLNTGTTTTGNVDLTLNGATATANYSVIENSTKSQEDLVYYGATIAAIPTDGVITATYKHALSKVKMQYQASSHTSSNPLLLYITQVKLVQFYGSGSATISSNSSNSIAWSNVGLRNSTYGYYKFDDVALLRTDAYDAPISFTNSDSDYAEDLYLMPQTTNTYATSSLSSDATYIEVVYRTTDSYGNNILGYTTASQHPQYDSTDSDWTTIANDPLYVKVAIPVSDVTLAPGVYYNLVLDFDGSAIEIAQDGFCDEDGTKITVPSITFPSPSEGGDINPNSNTEITLKINVLDWSTTPTAETLGN